MLISIAFENLNISNNLIHHLIGYQKFEGSTLWQYFNKLDVTMKLSDHETMKYGQCWHRKPKSVFLRLHYFNAYIDYHFHIFHV